MKKSSVSKATGILLIFFVQPILLFSLEIDHSIQQQDDQLTVHLLLTEFPIEKVQQVFRTGQTSQVQFEMRLFKESKGVWGFLGDQLLEEKSIIYNGSYDPFSEMYRLETAIQNIPAKTREYLEETSFFNAFRSVQTSFQFPSSPYSKVYLRLRVKFTPRKLMPPLNVLEPFLINHQKTTDWTQVPIPNQNPDQEAGT